MIRQALPEDASSIVAIYNHYVMHTTITFEETPVSLAEMGIRIDELQSKSLPSFVLEEAQQVLGYAYATYWKARSAYRFTAEVTVYLRHGTSGKGFGSQLYQSLFTALEQRGFHAAIGVIALPNEPSIRLHEKFGMKKSAHFEQVGFKFGRWIDVGYWHKTL